MTINFTCEKWIRFKKSQNEWSKMEKKNVLILSVAFGRLQRDSFKYPAIANVVVRFGFIWFECRNKFANRCAFSQWFEMSYGVKIG